MSHATDHAVMLHPRLPAEESMGEVGKRASFSIKPMDASGMVAERIFFFFCVIPRSLRF
jgi:hypothetical protein